MASFILRFQETCTEPECHSACSGTQTGTRANAEGPDTDSGRLSYGALKGRAIQAGTQTKTGSGEVEQSDADRVYSSLKPLSTINDEFYLMTQTTTFVQAEAADRDPGSHFFEIIPKCS